jgi:transposase
VKLHRDVNFRNWVESRTAASPTDAGERTLAVIPSKANRRHPAHCDFRRYKDRNRIEHMFGVIEHQRRIAARYDKIALSFASFLTLAAVRLWLKSFVNRA